MIWSLCERYGIKDVSTVVKIGDTVNDVLEGRNAGAYTVGVLSGACSEKELSRTGVDQIIDSIMDVRV